MKGKLLFLIIVICLIVTCSLTVNAMEGSGTESAPYIVESAEDFVAIQSNLSAYYKLASDIEVSSGTGAIVEGTFTGVFDGDGHTINVSITGATSGTNTFDSLFGVVSGKIKNLVVTGNITGSDKVAGVVGKLQGNGNVDNCVNYATILGRKNIGGVVGLLIGNATITNCKNYGSINGENPINNGIDIGGIVGCVWEATSSITTISNCYNAGVVCAKGSNSGGICGYFLGGSAQNCFNEGEITATDTISAGAIYGKTEQGRTYTVNGYYSTTDNDFIGIEGGKATLNSYIIESTGVAIYLGNGSGIRGEFHLNEGVFNAFCILGGYDASNIEYGAFVSTKEIVEELDGNILSKDAENSSKLVFAPAIKNGEKQYSFVDNTKGDGYHSFRFALTGFKDNKASYNMEFVILGYILLSDENGNQKIHCINTVESDRLASAVGMTEFNAVSIVRVAEATLSDGDFNDNQEALDVLKHITSFKDYETKIAIDGKVDYGHQNATFTSSISSDDTVVFKISNTNSVELFAYVNNLISNGYEKIFENEINENLFYTFKNGSVLINIAYTASTNQVTVTRETITALPTNTSKPVFEKVTTPSITQLKLEASVAEGMSYVIELSDGSFFIIDGGWSDNNYNEADKLYNTLVALAGERDIVIAGWIFTHCHGDHIGTFNLFVEKYHDNVIINQLLYNFPSDEDILNSGSSYMIDNSKQRYSNFKYVIDTYLEDTEIVKLHSGYKFYYADAEIEIIQTLEDLYPSTVANYDFNSSSTIFTVTIEGQKMIFLGDISDVGASRLNSVFGSSLKCDFLQIAHHGLNNGATIKALYLYIDPTYVLYPAPLGWYNSNANASANFFISTDSKTVKQIFVSGAQTSEIYLPYDGKLYDGEKLPGIEVEEPDDDERTEAERPSEPVDVPDAYFDLDLSGDEITDAKGNATVTVTGGGVEQTTVKHNGLETTTTAFTGDRYKEAYYMTLNFNDITTDSQWGDFVMGSSTFEIFLKLDSLPGSTVGLITSCNNGGTTLYLRKQAGGQLTFQIGSTKPNSNGTGAYSSTSNMNGSEPLAIAGDLLHIVGSYDKSTNAMKLYINGILVATADYGEGSFKGGNNADYIIGIGYNPQYEGEVLSSYANYELYEAKIYNVALTDEQVAQEYWSCVDNLFATEAENE